MLAQIGCYEIEMWDSGIVVVLECDVVNEWSMSGG